MPIASSREIFDIVMDEMPDFVEELDRKGINNPQVYSSPGKESKVCGLPSSGLS